jgi:DNA-binding MarR family transcriptional regulator
MTGTPTYWPAGEQRRGDGPGLFQCFSECELAPAFSRPLRQEYAIRCALGPKMQPIAGVSRSRFERHIRPEQDNSVGPALTLNIMRYESSHNVASQVEQKIVCGCMAKNMLSRTTVKCPLQSSATFGTGACFAARFAREQRQRTKGSETLARRRANTATGPGREEVLVRGGQDEEPQIVDIDVLADHLGYLIRRAQLWIFQDFARSLAAVDLTTAQYSVLVVAGANPGLSQASLSSTLGIERARFVRLVHDLERRGLAERRAVQNDRRSHAIHLTRAGATLLRRAKQLAAEHEINVERRISAPARANLVRLLRTFHEG